MVWCEDGTLEGSSLKRERKRWRFWVLLFREEERRFPRLLDRISKDYNAFSTFLSRGLLFSSHSFMKFQRSWQASLASSNLLRCSSSTARLYLAIAMTFSLSLPPFPFPLPSLSSHPTAILAFSSAILCSPICDSTAHKLRYESAIYLILSVPAICSVCSICLARAMAFSMANSAMALLLVFLQQQLQLLQVTKVRYGLCRLQRIDFRRNCSASQQFCCLRATIEILLVSCPRWSRAIGWEGSSHRICFRCTQALCQSRFSTRDWYCENVELGFYWAQLLIDQNLYQIRVKPFSQGSEVGVRVTHKTYQVISINQRNQWPGTPSSPISHSNTYPPNVWSTLISTHPYQSQRSSWWL